MSKIKKLLFILTATVFLTACTQNSGAYQGPTAPQPSDLPPPTNLLNE